MALRIFISHAKEDSQKARAIRDLLKTAGFLPWMDEDELLAGQNWKQEIAQVIEGMDGFIFCLTKQSVQKKGFVQAELRFALEQAFLFPPDRIFIIPLRFEDCIIPYPLKDLHCLDFYKEDSSPKLIRSLKKIQQQLSNTTTPPGTREILELYKLYFEKDRIEDIKRRLLVELEVEPRHPVYNLLFCITLLKGVDLTFDNLDPRLIDQIRSRLEWAGGEEDLIPTATFVSTMITHDYYETRFRAVHPSSHELIGKLASMRKKPELFLVKQLKGSHSFFYKIKPLTI